MRTIAIINQKGGCGKTTVAINLSAVLASNGQRTLLVDMDPQSHCALGLAVPEAHVELQIGDLLKAGLDGSVSMGDLTWQVARLLDLAPSTMALAGIEAELTHATDRDRRLQQVLSPVDGDYDFCVIDCPPSIGLLTFNALRAAGEVIIPVETGYFAMQGAVKQEATLQMLARRANHRAQMHVLPTMYDVRTKLAREVLAELKRHFGDKLLPVVVHFSAKLKEAASFGQAITEYDPASRGMEDFQELAQWLMDHRPAPVERAAAYVGDNPALSRAAELVERARALSRRSAALTEKLNGGSPIPPNGMATPQPPLPAMHSDAPSVMSDAPAATGPLRQADSPPQRTAPDGSTHSPVANKDAGAHAKTAPAPSTSTASSADHRADLARHPAASANTNGRSDAPAEHHPLTPESPPCPTASTPRVARLFGVRRTAQGLLFVQPANGEHHRLAIAGDFNGWSSDATPLRRNEQLGVWEAVIPVDPGRYRYRLVVDGQWIPDPYNERVEPNPFGELDSIVEVAAGG